MKNLKKIRLKELGQVLEDREMKLVVGGVIYICQRDGDNGETVSFTTDSDALAGSWSSFWTAAGKNGTCVPYGGAHSPYVKY